MDAVYKTWFKIYCEHPYWNLSQPEYLKVVPSKHTRSLATRFNILFKAEQNGIVVLCPEEMLADLPLELSTEILSFKLLLTDHNLPNYSGIEPFRDTHAIHLSNLNGKLEDVVAKGQSIPIRRSLSFIYRSNNSTSIYNIRKKDLREDLFLAPEDPHFSKAIDASPEGFYNSNVEEFEAFIYEPSLTKYLFGFISLLPEKISNENLPVSLPTRQVKMSYVLKAEHHDVANLQVMDMAGKVTFSKIVADTETNFLSDRAIDWKERSEHSFKLMNGKEKALREKLPTATNKNLKYTIDQEPFLEIFIHV